MRRSCLQLPDREAEQSNMIIIDERRKERAP